MGRSPISGGGLAAAPGKDARAACHGGVGELHRRQELLLGACVRVI
ncbi:hypothetical protein [Methylovirgula sp. 4M-Z18]|nr:hypothetical protein [Methylovirgula sp. 4M-Z18]